MTALRISVLGSGSVGLAIAAPFVEAGQNVTLLARGSALPELKRAATFWINSVRLLMRRDSSGCFVRFGHKPHELRRPELRESMHGSSAMIAVGDVRSR